MSYKPGKATVAAVTLAFSITLVPIAPASAGLISTDRFIGAERVTADRDRVASFVAREDVRKEFQKHGVNPDEAAARVAALSDAEIAQIAARLDSLPAGQDAASALIGAAVTIFIILLITDILCLTSVFNFTRCVNR
jgi:uncharacterized small protein (DUF1192 family)